VGPPLPPANLPPVRVESAWRSRSDQGNPTGTAARALQAGVRGTRVCAPRCETQLSVYNRSKHCWQHADVNFPTFRGKRLENGS